MGFVPSAERLAAIGLAIAALAILGLAFLVASDLTREEDLHREVIAVQQEQDSLEVLRVRLNEVVAAARLAAATGDEAALRTIEQQATSIETRLDTLRAYDESTAVPGLDALVSQARLLLVHARSVGPARDRGGPAAAATAFAETERVAADASKLLESAIVAGTAQVNERSSARIRVGLSLRTYVGWFVAGTVVVLGLLFFAFRRAQDRERAALKRIEWLAHFDSVTSLPNRALLSDRLAQEVARARRAEQSFGVLLFDLDGFKAVNDTWGHAAGDRVLTLVAERARKCVRASDTLGRLGGDEFLAILPETGAEGALAVAEKLRAALSEPYELAGAVARVGVSLGVGLFPANGDGPDALLRAADAALYRAKREGKNRVELAAPEAARREGADTQRAAD
jgi:diguanylate cyclase (GGDEF)-like protein